jgi:hypothetical protein
MREMVGDLVKNIQHLFRFELGGNYDTLTHSYMETNRCAVLANVNYSLNHNIMFFNLFSSQIKHLLVAKYLL